MNGMLNMVRASEHNRELLRAAERDRAQRRSELVAGRHWRGFNPMALLWSLRSGAARAERRAMRLARLAPTHQPGVAVSGGSTVAVHAHPLAALAADLPAEPPVDRPASPTERRFAPVADRIAGVTPSDRPTE